MSLEIGPLMIGATFGLIERKGALLACLASLASLSAFFSLVYPGDYRHEATWLAFVISGLLTGIGGLRAAACCAASALAFASGP